MPFSGRWVKILLWVKSSVYWAIHSIFKVFFFFCMAVEEPQISCMEYLANGRKWKKPFWSNLIILSRRFKILISSQNYHSRQNTRQNDVYGWRPWNSTNADILDTVLIKSASRGAAVIKSLKQKTCATVRTEGERVRKKTLTHRDGCLFVAHNEGLIDVSNVVCRGY